MLCGIFDVLYGSKVSILPVDRSRRWTAAKPLFCDQTLPSTCELSGRTMFTCDASMLYSGGIGQAVNCSVFGSNFTMAAWYILPSHQFPAWSARRPSDAFGKSGLWNGIAYSFTSPVLGSSRPRNCSPKLEYQAMPSLSSTTSCGEMVSRGRSYSV